MDGLKHRQPGETKAKEYTFIYKVKLFQKIHNHCIVRSHHCKVMLFFDLYWEYIKTVNIV